MDNSIRINKPLISFAIFINICSFCFSQNKIKVKYYEEYDYIQSLDTNFKNSRSENGYAIMQKGKLPNETYVIVDKNGTIITKGSMSANGLFNNGLAEVINENNKHGFINKSGDLIIPFIYDDANKFSEKLAPVKRNKLWGVINTKNEIIIPFKYHSLQEFHNGISICGNEENKKAYINKKGKLITDFIFDFFVNNFKDGLGVSTKNNKYGVVNKKGRTVVEYKYDFIWDYNEGIALVKLNNKYGFINKKGKLIIPVIYDKAHSFSEGLAPVFLKSEKNSWGYINKNGEIKIPFKFNGFIARPFSESLASVYINRKTGFINKKGEFVIQPIYSNSSSFENGLAEVEVKNAKFLINKEGHKIIDLKTEEIIMEISE